jgi:hypothetical protein
MAHRTSTDHRRLLFMTCGNPLKAACGDVNPTGKRLTSDLTLGTVLTGTLVAN